MNIKKHTTVLLFIVYILVFVTGCNQYGFFISFKKIGGLKVDDAVIYKNEQIGQVKKITYENDATFLVGVLLDKDQAHFATQNTQFYIDTSPVKKGEKAIVLSPGLEGGKPIAQGATVKGKSKQDQMIAKWKHQPFWTDLEKTFQGVLKELKDIPDSQEYKNLKKRLSELESQMAQSGKEIADKFHKEILPKLEEEIKRFMDMLEQQGKEDKAQSLEKELNKLQSI